MITKLNDHKIKHQLNIYHDFFLNYNNLIKSETKPIMNLNSQSIQYQRIKLKKKFEKKKV
jgi:hypothetical protein